MSNRSFSLMLSCLRIITYKTDLYGMVIKKTFDYTYRRPRVMHDHHDPQLVGHPGTLETLRAIGLRYFWPNIKSDVERYVRSCLTCACAKANPRHRFTALRAHHSTKPRENVALDWMGPYPRSTKGKRFLLVVTDLFTRWVEAFPMVFSATVVVERVLETEMFPRYGYPRAILIDNAPQLTSRRWGAKCRDWHTLAWTTPVYHPQANPTERRNQELKNALRLQLQNGPHNRWDQCIPSILFSLRCRANAASGYAPAKALFGFDLLRPGQWQDPPTRPQAPADRAEQLAEINQNQQHYQERYVHPEPANAPHYNIGDKVFVKEHHFSDAVRQFHAGFAPKYAGPFEVTNHVGPTAYWINKGHTSTKVHVNQLKPAPIKNDA